MSVSLVLTIHCEGTRVDGPAQGQRCTSFLQEQAMLDAHRSDTLWSRLKALEAAAAASGWRKAAREHFCPDCLPGLDAPAAQG